MHALILFLFVATCAMVHGFRSSMRQQRNVPSLLKMSKMTSEPRNPLSVSRDGAMSTVRNIAIAAMTSALIPAGAAFAYGDAEELARSKKPSKEKLTVLETDLGIPYLIKKKGTGAYPNAGDYVVISYTGFLSDGTVFDTTDIKGKKPLGFKMGAKQIIPGLESVVEQLQNGAEATCSIPAKYAYGSKGVCLKDGNKECLIPPNENLKYFIKVKTVGVGYN